MSEFGALSGHLGYLLHRTDLQLIGRVTHALAGFGVTPARASALVYIALHEGCDQMALGRALGVNRTSTMNAVDELVALGAVERRPGRDRRSNALHLSVEGRTLRPRIEAATAAADAANFRVLSDEEQDSLRSILKKLHDFDFANQPEPVVEQGSDNEHLEPAVSN